MQPHTHTQKTFNAQTRFDNKELKFLAKKIFEMKTLELNDLITV